MGCNCGKNAAAAAAYPKQVTLPDGSQVTVTSVADERIQRQKAQARMRERGRETGYTVTRS